MVELSEERRVVKSALSERDIEAWVFEEDAGARPSSIQETFLSEIDDSGLYVGILWRKYGTGTVEEYKYARRKGKDCLMYIKSVQTKDRDPKLDKFISDINNIKNGITVNRFKNNEELREHIRRDISSWSARKIRNAEGSYRWLRDSNIVNSAEVKYFKKLEDSFNVMKVLGMREPVPLRDIYVQVNLLNKIRERHHRTVESMESQFRRDTRGYGDVVDTIKGFDILNIKDKIIVLGKPCAGKTTFLKSLIFQFIDKYYDYSILPIFISLKNWSESGDSIIDFIKSRLEDCGLPNEELFLTHMLLSGRCLILLDGLDEITNNQARSIDLIRKFEHKYSKNKFVISCRIASYNHYFEKFSDVEVADFNDSQIENFIYNFYRYDKKIGKECWSKLSSHAPTKELASNPLLLVLLCIAFDEVFTFPDNRADLYQLAVDALLVKWDASRRIRRDELYKSLTLRRKKILLSRIAVKTFAKGKYFITQKSVESIISDYICNLPEVKDSSVLPTSESILRSIEAQHGLLVKRARSVYSFSHLTIQEFFTALYIVSNPDKSYINSIINEKWIDRSWREVVLLVSGMVSDATILVRNMRKWLRHYAKKNNIAFILSMTDRYIKPWASYSKLSCRCLNMYYILESRNLVIQDSTKNLKSAMNDVLDMAMSFDKNLKVSSQTINPNSYVIDNTLFTEKIDRWTQFYNSYFTSTAFRPEYFRRNFPKDSRFNDSMKNYIYCSKLLILCLGPDFDIDKEVREKITNSILKEPLFARPDWL